jgi:hypothetical protein
LALPCNLVMMAEVTQQGGREHELKLDIWHRVTRSGRVPELGKRESRWTGIRYGTVCTLLHDPGPRVPVVVVVAAARTEEGGRKVGERGKKKTNRSDL